MKFRKPVLTGVVLSLAVLTSSAAELISPFAGSELLGEYRTEFDRFSHLDADDATVTVEGQLHSRIFAKPSGKSTYELFRSYEMELRAAGFELITAIGDDKPRVQRLGRVLNRDQGNRLTDRPYRKHGKPTPGSPADYLTTFGEHYIAATKNVAGVDTRVVVLIADRKDLYLVDVLESAAMEAETVSLSLDALRSQMASEGRVAVYGILFDSGSSTIRGDSAATLDTIAGYLRENPARSYYVVGHTDDQGALEPNMRLARDRAEASMQALIERVPSAASRLKAHGVGPLSPVATNGQEAGRQLNRRVELVLALN